MVEVHTEKELQDMFDAFGLGTSEERDGVSDAHTGDWSLWRSRKRWFGYRPKGRLSSDAPHGPGLWPKQRTTTLSVSRDDADA
ncbi:MAG: hypothetical protein FWD57_12240 [Polyangiaceae bacterium]|nr:hypothetical protein [Polyangiaceae bacterium]